jgi:hypothetical protein
MKALFLGMVLTVITIQTYEGNLSLNMFLLVLFIIGILSTFMFRQEDDTLQKIQDFCSEYDIAEYKNIAKVEASKLKSTYEEKLTYNKCFQHIGNLNIYRNLDEFNISILKAHIANYYYNLK